jgi:hypothetical protein
MLDVSEDAYRTLAEAYSLGVLEAEDRASFERHRLECSPCREAAEQAARAAASVAAALEPAPPRGELRWQLLDLAEAPRWPFDLAAIPWQQMAPGVRIHTLKEEPERGVRKCLVWAEPGARNGTHRHGGDECILVLKGGLKDERGEYHAGELCRSREGFVHSEEVLPGEDCVCYVVYYGPLEFL